MDVSAIKPGIYTDVQRRISNTDSIEIKKPEIDYREAFGLPKGFTINNASNYNPQIERLSTNLKFDIQYRSATTLSDGSKLIRPVCLSLGEVTIKPTENEKEYQVTCSSYMNKEGNGPLVRIMSEDELLNNRTLCAGTIKETESPERFELEYKDKNGEEAHFIANKKGCLDVLEKNFLYL